MKNCISKIGLLALVLLLAGNLAAKKVKFMVNMTGQVKNITGVHVTGDFQTLAGYAGGDWNSATTLMSPEADTNIYSVVVDVPAMAKYEFKFVNGDQFYEAEFVPVESRVGWNFNDNRWFYVDSLAPDTTIIGPLVFAGNAPAGKRLLRMVVDVHEEAAVSPLGVHVVGGFDGGSTPAHMYSFVAGLWEHIGYVDSLVGSTTFRYRNGETVADNEVVTGSCTSGADRTVVIPKDTVLPVVCFGSCAACITSAADIAWQPEIAVYPNPAHGEAHLRLNNAFGDWKMQITDLQGRILRTEVGSGESLLRVDCSDWTRGLYFVRLTAADGALTTQKLVVQ